MSIQNGLQNYKLFVVKELKFVNTVVSWFMSRFAFKKHKVTMCEVHKVSVSYQQKLSCYSVGPAPAREVLFRSTEKRRYLQQKRMYPLLHSFIDQLKIWDIFQPYILWLRQVPFFVKTSEWK